MTTVTAPAACAGVVAVMVVVLMRRTFVAAVPPKVMVTPTWNPLPAIVTFVPPAAAPAPGETVVRLGRMLMLADFASEQPAAVTVTLRVTVPELPVVKARVRVPLPELIVPLPIVQAYEAPVPASATEAVEAASPFIVAATLMAALGIGLTVTVLGAEAALVQPFTVTVTV